MANLISNVTICNWALAKVGAASISSLSDTTPNAKVCNNRFWGVRDALYRTHIWAFAARRVQLATVLPSPVFGYENAFPVPPDFIRLLPPDVPPDLQLNLVTSTTFTNGNMMGAVDRPLENVPTGPADPNTGIIPTATAILTNESAPLNVRYIAKIEDPNLMDPLFREALAAALAVEICETLTQNTAKKRTLSGEFQDRISEARRAQGIESPPQNGVTDDWILVRL